jgi:hypothetical protein
MNILKAFVAGFLATLVFHQGLLGLLYAAGASPKKPFAMEPAGPLHVPSVLSLAFWGGVWGIPLWLVLARMTGPAFWITALVFGAILPSIVALFVVMPMKGMPMAGGWKGQIIVGALLLNGAWGIGTALFARLFGATPFR